MALLQLQMYGCSSSFQLDRNSFHRRFLIYVKVNNNPGKLIKESDFGKESLFTGVCLKEKKVLISSSCNQHQTNISAFAKRVSNVVCSKRNLLNGIQQAVHLRY